MKTDRLLSSFGSEELGLLVTNSAVKLGEVWVGQVAMNELTKPMGIACRYS